MRRFILLSLVLSAFAVAAASLWYHRNLWGIRSERSVELEIIKGSTAHDILLKLHREELIPSVLAARIYLKTQRSGQALHYGHYRFPRTSRPVDVLERLLDGRVEITFDLGSGGEPLYSVTFAGTPIAAADMHEQGQSSDEPKVYAI